MRSPFLIDRLDSLKNRPTFCCAAGRRGAKKCYAASGPSAPTIVGQRPMQVRLCDEPRRCVRKRHGGATKCDVRATTTGWVCQPKRQRLSCPCCLRENRSGSRSRTRLQGIGDQSQEYTMCSPTFALSDAPVCGASVLKRAVRPHSGSKSRAHSAKEGRLGPCCICHTRHEPRDCEDLTMR
jgi:hypothetical protein